MRPSLPILEGLALRVREAFGCRVFGDMLLKHVVQLVEQTDTDDRDFARLAIEPGLPAYGADVVVPGVGQAWAVEQQLVDVDQAPVAARLKPIIVPANSGCAASSI